MPKGRMLNKKISFDEVVATLSLKSALFFTWCIPNLDVEGKILGDYNYLKGNVVPYRKDFSLKDIEKCISELHESGLILCYGNGYKYLKFNGFEKNQKINPDKEAISEIPDPTPEQLQSNSRVTLGKVKRSLDLNIREGEDKPLDDFFFDFLPLDLNQSQIEAWREWVEYRKESRKKITKHSAKRQIEFLLQQPDMAACINQSIQNQWQGLFEVKDGKNKSSNSKGADGKFLRELVEDRAKRQNGS